MEQRGGGVKTIHLPDSVVVECRLRKEVESTTGGLPRQREGLRLENLHLENLHQRRGPSEHSEAGFTEQSSPFVSPALLSLECKKKKKKRQNPGRAGWNIIHFTVLAIEEVRFHTGGKNPYEEDGSWEGGQKVPR